jgi:hypothetical protein
MSEDQALMEQGPLDDLLELDDGHEGVRMICLCGSCVVYRVSLWTDFESCWQRILAMCVVYQCAAS